MLVIMHWGKWAPYANTTVFVQVNLLSKTENVIFFYSSFIKSTHPITVNNMVKKLEDIDICSVLNA